MPLLTEHDRTQSEVEEQVIVAPLPEKRGRNKLGTKADGVRQRTECGRFKLVSHGSLPEESPTVNAGAPVAGAVAGLNREAMIAPASKSVTWPEAPEELTAGLAHDVRNLLSAVGLLSDLLLRTEPLSAVQQRYAREIHSTSMRGIDLVRQLMPGTRRTEPVILCADRMLREMSHLLEHVCGERVELVVRAHTPSARIHADPRQMERVILNLAVNARDAMPQGGRLTIETRAWQVSADEAKQWSGIGAPLHSGRHIVISLADTGCGMDKAALASAFLPFFTTKGSGGIGLGLAIVHSIVAHHGGSVAMESAPGHGTRVQVVLPAASAAAVPRGGPSKD